MFPIQTVGDLISCGDSHGPQGSENVFVNGRAAVRVGDSSLGHGDWPPTPAIAGSSTVFVNGQPVVRQGDLYAPHTNSLGVTHANRSAQPLGQTVLAG